MSAVVPFVSLSSASKNAALPAAKASSAVKTLIRRRPDPTQGRALETLGHAIDYLADMRLWDEHSLPGDAAAMRILMGCSRSVFRDCAEVVPVRQRLLHWLGRAQENA